MRYLVLSFLAGLIFGFGTVTIKRLLESNEILALFINPIFIITAISGIFGFFLFQVSLVKEKGSHVYVVSTSAMTLTSILGGYFLLGEAVRVTEVVGIFLITLSVVMLMTKLMN